MRRIACAVLVLLAGCRSKPSGVEIVVDSAPSNVKFVRVFLGTSNVMQPLDGNSSVSVPMPVMAATQSGSNVATQTQNIFVRDHGNSNDTLPYTGSPITFEFESSGNGEIYAAIVVGYTGSGDTDVPVASALQANIPLGSNGITYYHVSLDPSALPFLWSTVANAATPVTHPQCAGYNHANNIAFIVEAADDEDCDGYLDGSADECSMFVFNDPAGIDTTGSTCLAPTASADPGTAECRLGGHACKDGVGVNAASPCLPTNTCVPGIACSCMGSNVAGDGLECLLASDHAESDGMVCSFGVPATGLGKCAVGVPPIPTGGMFCDTTSGNNGLSIAGDATDFQSMVDVGGVTYRLSKVTESCAAVISISPDGSGNVGSGEFPPLLLRVELDNGAAVIVPLAFSVAPSGACDDSSPGTCTAMPGVFGSELAQCAGAWEPPTTTGFSGTSPSLTADGKTMYFLAGSNVMTAGNNGSAWTLPTPVPDVSTANTAVAVRISLDGTILFITDATGLVNMFNNSGNGFKPYGSAFSVGATASIARSFSPDPTLTDALFGGSDGNVWEATSAGTQPYIFVQAGAPLATKSATPFLGDDDLAIWYVSGDPFTIMVTQRASTADQPITPLAVKELPVSMGQPQWPWVSPLDRTNGTQLMVFSVMGSMAPTIYVSQRAKPPY